MSVVKLSVIGGALLVGAKATVISNFSSFAVL